MSVTPEGMLKALKIFSAFLYFITFFNTREQVEWQDSRKGYSLML